jgi:flagellar biosynthesis/type III secretory pathway ATPase
MNSVSRLSSQLSTPQGIASARRLREALATLDESKDLIELGAYVSGTNPRLDATLRIRNDITDFLRQDVQTSSTPRESTEGLEKIAQRL